MAAIATGRERRKGAIAVPDTELPAVDRPAQLHTGRRAFLTRLARGSLALVSLLAVGGIARFLSYEPTGEAPTLIPVGKPAGYASGPLTYVAPARAYIGHDDGGLYALDAVCTHLGCLVQQQTGDGFACPCHGSRFAADGRVQAGPANQALPHLALQFDQDGQVVVDRGRQVIPATRLAIPA
jgi:cytochrome b6-f complex iron-sulfur subunit